MLYIWGSGNNSAVAGNAGTRPCPICNSDQQFNLIVNYRYRHFWYVISFVTKRSYSFVCARCSNGVEARRGEYEDKLGKDPIPFMRRRGWVLVAAPMAALVAIGAVASGEHSKQTEALYAAPKIGDIYSVDMSKVTSSPDSKPVYGTMKLVAIDGGHEKFMLARAGYDKKKWLRKDINADKVRDDAYYDANDVVDLSPEKVKELNQSGAIFDVIR